MIEDLQYYYSTGPTDRMSCCIGKFSKLKEVSAHGADRILLASADLLVLPTHGSTLKIEIWDCLLAPTPNRGGRTLK